jgi:hypothetical protein
MKVKLLFLFLLISLSSSAQLYTNDTLVSYNHNRTYYVPRVSVSFQRSLLLEAGICRQWSYRKNSYSKTIGYDPKGAVAYFGTYLSGEAVVNNRDYIPGVKLGAEMAFVGGASTGIILGLEATNYFYQSNQYLGLTPKIIIPVTKNLTPLAFLSYGYCFNDFNSFSNIIGNHRFSLLVNLCFKEHKQINKMEKDFIEKVKLIKSVSGK